MTQLLIKSISEEEYNTFKNELKTLFPFVSVRRNTQNYAMGGFNINPTKKINYEFSEEQTTALMNWLIEKDLFVLDMTAKEYAKVICADNKTLLYQLSGKEGFSFITKYEEIN